MQNEKPNQEWDNEQKKALNPIEGQENLTPANQGIAGVSATEGFPSAKEASAEQTKASVVKPQKGEPGNVTEEMAEKGFVPSTPVKESGFKRFLRFLFGADTRVGRVMRPLLRTVAMIVIAFAAGLLVAYFTLYQPALARYDAARNDVQQLNIKIGDAQTAITTLEGEKTALQATMAGQQAENELANYRVYFLIVKNDVMRARLALVDEENGPGGPTAIAALDDLRIHLADLLPYVETDNPVLADLLTNRLDVVQNELARDSKQAKVELESFYSNLLELEGSLFE